MVENKMNRRDGVVMKNKKTVVMVIAAIMVIALAFLVMVGCSDEQTSNKIKKWEPQDKEVEQVLGILTEGSYYSIGSYIADKDMKSVNFGYEYYKGSDLISDEECGSVSLTKEAAAGLVGVYIDDKDFRMFCSEKEESAGAVRGSLKGWKNKGKSVGFSPLEEEEPFEKGKKCYIAALAEGGSLENPEAMHSDKELLKKNKKNWLFYVVFSDEKEK
jgi:hypothetical protein